MNGTARGSIPEDPTNFQQWAARYNGPGNSTDNASSLAASPDGSTVFVTGASYGLDSSTDYATFAYSASGAEVWAARYNGPANSGDYANSIAASPDGSTVFVTGYSAGSDDTYDYATVAYSAATGAELWAARYNGPANFANSIAVSPDGSTVFVTGYSVGSGSYDYATVAYSAATGAELWAARYNGPANYSGDDANSIAVSPDGSKVFVTGASSGLDSSADYATLAYSAATGAELWVARYNGPGDFSDDAPTSLAVSPDGSKVFVTGTSDGSGTNDYATVAYSAATGAQLWAARYNGPANSSVTSRAVGSYNSATSLAVSPDGSKVFVTGSSYDSVNRSDYATLAYSAATGAELWAARYNGPRNYSDYARSLAVSPDGSKVFVTGSSVGSGDYDYATLAYSAASGAELWVARYNGPGDYSDDEPTSLAVSPDGSKVFVTGTSKDLGSGTYDYATVAYHLTTTCANGKDETGPASGVVRTTVEPQAASGAPYVHGVNCDVVAENGL